MQTDGAVGAVATRHTVNTSSAHVLCCRPATTVKPQTLRLRLVYDSCQPMAGTVPCTGFALSRLQVTSQLTGLGLFRSTA
jgi:hypothetical protein